MKVFQENYFFLTAVAASIEPIKITTRKEREEILKAANYNLFKIRSENVILDFLTDSGTSAMSSAQWAAMMKGDESYACATSYYNFEKAVSDQITFIKNNLKNK